ncbi:trypsin-like peptidase domain-containing protein [Halorussus amylolyticus]|uniref:trypsin-like peptidase domain-containing protein n=1 Tax=Halorussus amylolyticus TaxID=1126242 RepID=UPI00104B37D7|nr:trypsin-like peptidase domain-containing protein [Halorussus amylolyticus]
MPDSTLDRRQFLRLGGVAAATGLAGCSADAPAADDGATATTDSPTETGTQTTQEGSESVYTRLYRDTIGSVVLVRTGQGQGTGFVYDDDHVVTNAHVVGDATETEIRFSEGQWSSGEVVGSDPHSDLATVEVEEVPSSATPVSFAERDPVVGQEVVAIGNPYDLDGSATTGIVSGIDRSIPSPTGYRIPDAIQTDAAVNPGNSGGPLVSLDGEVVAVINSGGGDNIGFGISAALTERVVPRLIENGEFDHAYLGVTFTNVTPSVADANDLDEPRGLLIVNVVDGGPADGTLQGSDPEVVDGRRVPVGGDVLLEIEGSELLTAEDLGSYLALETRANQTVELTIRRDGDEETVPFELGERPDDIQG